MRVEVFLTLAFGAALALACSTDRQAPAAAQTPAPAASPTPQTTPQPYVVEWSEQSVTSFAGYRDLVFHDETLEEFMDRTRKALPDGGPWPAFARAGEAARAGRAGEVQRHLRAGLEHPEAEVRARLWAWNALRARGEQPPPEAAREVRGVVIEVPVDDYLDVLAVYSDGRVRYLNEKRGAVLWDDTGKSDINTLAAEVTRAAAPLVGKVRRVEKHLPASTAGLRVTVLTYAGMYVAEGDPLNPPDDLAPTFSSGMRLLLTLLEKLEE